MNKPTATGFNLKARIERTQRWISAHMAAKLHETGVLLLPAPANAQTWERDAPHCPDCNAPMIRNIFDTIYYKAGQYFCGDCHQLRVQTQIFRTKAATIHNLFPTGELTRLTRTKMQNAARQTIIASYSTHKDLTQDAAALAHLQSAKQQQTAPLPARDIERANSAKLPITPIPQTRADLFADVPEKAIAEDEDATEKRAAIKLPATTKEIPAMNAEVILDMLRRGETHEQSTGENERVDITQENWML